MRFAACGGTLPWPLKERSLGFLQRSTIGVVLGPLCVFIITLIVQWKHIRPRADDPAFLDWALSDHIVKPDWGPVYIEFLRAVSWISTEKLVVFQISIIVISTVSSVLIFLWIYVRTNDRIISAAFVSLYLSSGLSPIQTIIGIDPVVPPSSASGHLALCFMVAGVTILAHYGWRRPQVLAASTLCFVMGTYCRPELLLVAFFCYCLTAISLIKQWIRPSTGSPYVAHAMTLIILCAILGLVLSLGVPFPSAERALLAFGQHSALSFCTFNPSDCLDYPDPFIHWKHYYQKLYNNSANIFAAAFNNLGNFFSHLLRNALATAFTLSLGFLLFFAISPRSLISTLQFIALATFMWRLISVGRRSRWQPPDKMLLAVTLLAILPQLVNWLLLYPRMHYVVTPLILGCGLLLGFAARSDAGDGRKPAHGV